MWRDPDDNRSIQEQDKCMKAYVWKKRHINSYYCPTREFMSYVLEKMQSVNKRLITMCGTLDSNYCKDCRNCETYYWQTMRRLKKI
jgi:hypothetical protein